MESSKNKQYYNFIDSASDDNILDWINPTAESKSADELHSTDLLGDGLSKSLIENEPFFNDFREITKSDDFYRLKTDEVIDLGYLSLFAYNSQDESRSIEERQKWADYFTQQSIKIYGASDPEVVNRIENGESAEIIKEYEPIFADVKNWLENKYKGVFEALETEGRTDKLSPNEVYDFFEAGLEALKIEDARFEDWKVEMKPEASILSCEANKKAIMIGENRAKMDPRKLKGLFAHEVLRHAMTAENGKDLGVEASLPHYINTEEGFAKIYELSMSGEFPQLTMDNYSDIGWCLGQIDGVKHTRQELIERKLQRKQNQGQKITEKTIKVAENSAARIFRGTPGSEEVSGIFTKDISYFEGLIPGLKYIKNRLSVGDNIDEIMAFASAAKFNLYDEEHQKIIKKKIMGKYAVNTKLLLSPPVNDN